MFIIDTSYITRRYICYYRLSENRLWLQRTTQVLNIETPSEGMFFLRIC